VVNLGFAAQCADGGDCGAAASGEFCRAGTGQRMLRSLENRATLDKIKCCNHIDFNIQWLLVKKRR
jgi:hypothetical protein